MWLKMSSLFGSFPIGKNSIWRTFSSRDENPTDPVDACFKQHLIIAEHKFQFVKLHKIISGKKYQE